MKIVLSGASGLIGRPLIEALKSDHEVVVLKRPGSPHVAPGVREVIWDPPAAGQWEKELDGASGVINLSGAPIIEKRWSGRRKKELSESRILTARALVSAIDKARAKPEVFLSASAIGFYGSRDDSPLDEKAPSGQGFLAELCRSWESEAAKASTLGVRTVFLRTGIVLAREGGALKKMLPPFRFFLGGPLGNGRQCFSWIHLEDEIGGILKALGDLSLRGPLNLTAPHPVTMDEFVWALGRAINRPAFLRVPGPALQILLGEMSEMLLTGQKVLPQKLLERGYRFKYPRIHEALEHLLDV